MAERQKSNTWLELRIPAPRESVPGVESELEAAGALSITLTDPADSPVLEPGVGETPLWPEVVVTALFEAGTDVQSLCQRLLHLAGSSSAELISTRVLADQDWERAWMADFTTMQFGRDLWIVPSNEEVPAGAGTILRLDPGLAFGTGTHATTRLCLEWIDAQNCTGKSVLDFGCGSGVLGIATALKGASRVWCIDNDPQALIATRENALRNGVIDRLVIQGAEEYGELLVDMVVANILAGTLIQLAPALSGALHPGGRLVLSGILEHQGEEVAQAYAPWVPDLEFQIRDGWLALSGVKAGHN